MFYPEGLVWQGTNWQSTPAFDIKAFPQPNTYTTLVWPCSPWHISAHQQRLYQQLQWLKLPRRYLPDWPKLLAQLPTKPHQWRVRITLSHRFVRFNAVPYVRLPDQPAKLTTALYQRPDVTVKHGQLDMPIHLLVKAKRLGFDEVALLNAENQLTETAFGAIALKSYASDPWLFTPPDMALPSITAQWFQHWLDNTQQPWVYACCQPSQVEAMMIMSAIRGMVPVTSLNHQTLNTSIALPIKLNPCCDAPG
jgi:branched-subunit amino acid aminotransferase/4-amino-4-deoxychorismate lyase